MAAGGPGTMAPIGMTGEPAWWRDWRGECVAIVAGGPSVKHAPIDMLRDRIRTIAINESYRLAPWADVLYSCDYNWWALHKGAKDFVGLRLSHDLRACNEFKLHRVMIEQVDSNEIKMDKPGYVGAGGNSAFQALNLAVQFGVTGVMLIGVDCSLDHGQHWHGRHPMPLSNPASSNVERWRRAFDGVADRLRALGVDVVNCSAISALTRYPKISIPEALQRWQL